MQEYHRQRVYVLSYDDKHLTGFAHILGKHAVRMCDLALADRKCSKMGMAQTWSDIVHINETWANMVCRGERDPGSEFCQITSKLVNRYSEALGHFVMNRTVPHDMDDIIQTEARFYRALAIQGKEHEMRQQWVNYTVSVYQMLDNLDRHGVNSDNFYLAAAQCIKTGVMMGQWLNQAIYGPGTTGATKSVSLNL